jgi:MFS family permease
VVGTAFCGIAWSMPSLIVFRLIQGVGAGAIQPVSITVVGDLYSVRERGKIQGYLASVWGISSVLGPLAGGLIIQHLSWSWIFWINVPVGLAAAAGFAVFLKEDVAGEKRSVDLAGAALFAVAVAALMVGVTEIGTSDSTTLAAAGICVVSIILFVIQERRARDPMMAFGLWGHRPISTANAATLLSGMALIGLTTFLPMYVQGVLNRSALVAGFALTMMLLGWPIAATVAAKNFARFGLRALLTFGAALMPLGTVAFVFLGPGTSPVLAGIGSLIMGLGMGFFSTTAIVIIQDSVGWAERGAATASNMFSRNLGSTLGATVLGGVLNLSLAHRGSGVSYDQIRQLFDDPGALIGGEAVRTALGQSLHLTFWGVFVLTVLTLLVATLLPSVALKPGPREITVE